MEEVMQDFDEWIKNFKPTKPRYKAVFDNDGTVIGVYPETAVDSNKNSVEIDDETAQLINEGKININSCYIDIDSGTFQIAEIKVLNKIDDILHRVIDKQWSKNIEEDDLYITVNTVEKELTFELSEKYHGTRSSISQTKRKIHWDGSTVMTFLITDYNDPNSILNFVKISIDDLVGKSKSVKLNNLPDRFSVYTKRIFPNYVIEYK